MGGKQVRMPCAVSLWYEVQQGSVLVLSLRSRHGLLASKAYMNNLDASYSAHLEVIPNWRRAATVLGSLAPGQQGSGGLGCTETGAVQGGPA